jgi:hypothetical protein
VNHSATMVQAKMGGSRIRLATIRSVLFGTFAVDFPQFARLMQHANMLHSTGPMNYTRLWDGLRTKRWLLPNLHRFAETQCSVPHDIVYALRSISCGCGHAKSICDKPHCLSQQLPVDYRQSVDELFVSIASRAAEKDAIAVLACASLRKEQGAEKAMLPSARLAHRNQHGISENEQFHR